MAEEVKVKIQILGLNYAPEKIGIAVYSTGLADEFSARGHDVVVVCAHPYYPQWKLGEGWPQFRYRTIMTDSGAKVIHCPLYVPQIPTAKSRMIHYASFALTALPRLLGDAVRKRPDVVFVVAPSLVSAISGWATARLTGAKLWLHVQDFEVEAAFATGAIGSESRLGRMALAFERWMLGRFDIISSISQPMLDKLHEKGVPQAKIYELRNWANLSRVTVVEGVSPMREELGITTKYVAYYSGNVAAKQGLEIIPAAARLLQHRDDLTFVICGEGSFLSTLKDAAEGLNNIQFLPLQPLEKLSDALGMADVHLLPQIAGVAELVLPSKLTNMLASGRPVIATAGPDTALAQELKGSGIVTPPGDVAAFASTIEALLDDSEQRAAFGKQARLSANANWDMDRIICKLETKLCQLAPKVRERDQSTSVKG
ncbi:WcaI family glycosyltransferase [Celeribacter baekdonensis]|uniref:Glycosyl transferase n=1 Tax=Celeribacter baekdonensis B30 TaxID=1208323 RepID=K2JIP4_9RHOB|nr:WcaI family glycosyltransferase [Celeribacter baekdonensis]EKE74342.1 glycosyl transferase [Celeribacter baekdonensis B30]